MHWLPLFSNLTAIVSFFIWLISLNVIKVIIINFSIFALYEIFTNPYLIQCCTMHCHF